METSSRWEALEPVVDTLKWFKGLVPTSLKPGRPHFQFITVHYIYLISLTIVGSILLFPAGVMPYTDALFFAAGSATQSGLNTIDVNKLHTYQQIVLMLIACVANPVFINTVVVFIRLHWFEKRFQNIVKDAQRVRRTRTMSRSRSQAKEDMSIDTNTDLENGVQGKQIRVLHDTTQFNGMTNRSMNGKPADQMNGHAINPEIERARKEMALSLDSTNHDGGMDEKKSEPAEDANGTHPALKRDIVFADETQSRSQSQNQSRVQSQAGSRTQSQNRRSSDDDERLPEIRDPDHHIAFLQRQRKPDKGTLRIPGPRDFDRGDVPREVDSDDEGNELENAITIDDRIHSRRPNGSRRSSQSEKKADEDEDDPQQTRRNIAFAVPERPKRQAQTQQEQDKHSTRFNIMHPLSSIKPKRRLSSSALSNTFSRLRDPLKTLTFTRSQDREMPDVMPYLSWEPTIGRNSAFIDLSEEQREELGGIEYRSLKTLAIILVCYFLGFHLLGIVVLLPWIRLTETYGSVVTADGQNRAWWGIFTPASMFNDLGFTLTPDSMISFQTAVLPLLFGSFLIIIGNTGFPCMLRFIIWVLYKITPTGSAIWEELRFLLDHPRRCFTLLFPSKATWWLFWLLCLLNGIDLIFFIILDLNDPTVTTLTPGFRVLNGWFQAVSTRTAGFACVNLADLHPAIQVSYLIMMYISVFPIAISVRRTNVYEEKSLGLYGGEDDDDGEGEKSYVGQHLRRQLSFDLWYIFLGLFIIAVVEGSRLENTNEYAFTLFSCLFEIVSAYGTVGLSLGYPNINASFSAEFAVLSKLVIIAMMLRGRHRGLPYALDRAILLPSENLHKKETEEAARRAGRRGSMSISKAPTDERVLPPEANSTSVMDAALPRVNTSPTQFRRTHSRRTSDMSNETRSPATRSRRKSLAGLLSAGLSAGPSPSGFKKD